MRRLGAVALGLATAAAVAGCSAGKVTQTSTQEAGVNGVNVDVGDIAIRNVQLAYPDNEQHLYRVGADIPVELTIVNQGGTSDELKSISSPIAEDVQVSGTKTMQGDTALRAELPEGGHGAESSAAEPSSEAGSSSSAAGSAESGSAEPSGSSSSAAAPGDEQEIGKITVTVIGLTRQVLRPGQVLPVTIQFAKAGAVNLQIPVANPTAALEEGGEGGEH